MSEWSRIFIGNLPPDTTIEDIVELCKRFKVTDEDVSVSNKEDFSLAWVNFPNKEIARSAIYELHGVKYCGDNIEVNWARKSWSGSYDEKRSQKPKKFPKANNYNFPALPSKEPHQRQRNDSHPARVNHSQHGNNQAYRQNGNNQASRQQQAPAPLSAATRAPNNQPSRQNGNNQASRQQQAPAPLSAATRAPSVPPTQPTETKNWVRKVSNSPAVQIPQSSAQQYEEEVAENSSEFEYCEEVDSSAFFDIVVCKVGASSNDKPVVMRVNKEKYDKIYAIMYDQSHVQSSQSA